MAIFTYNPSAEKNSEMWITDDFGTPVPIIDNVANLNPFNTYTIHHNFAIGGGGGAGLANVNAPQSLLKNHPKQPSFTPTNAIYEPVGSSVTAYPFDMGNDIDWLMWFDTEQDLGNFMSLLAQEGFKLDNTGGYDPDMFVSYKKGTENYILTDKADFFDKFIKARNLCQFLNLLDKEDRIAVHAAVMKGEFPSFEPTPFASCGYGKEQPEW